MSLVINIKNMVCHRCILVVKQILAEEGLTPLEVNLGSVVLSDDKLAITKLKKIDHLLQTHGFERIDDKKGQLLESMKALIIDAIHHQDHFSMNLNWSNYLSEKLGYDYNYLSSLFSSIVGITLEQYIIKQKIEKVKEYLFYDQLSIKEIAFKLGYSSMAHLSAQFKKVTGMTPSKFKEARIAETRKPIDGII